MRQGARTQDNTLIAFPESMTSFVVIIPARYASTRFPGKPLAQLHGKPMVAHVIDRARESGADEVVVATDDRRIAEAAATATAAWR